jgi:AcrR family transcriptional regulator
VAREGAAQVGEVQRVRLLSSAVHVAAEVGYSRMSVSRVTRGAGVSRRTFYDVFADREDCFLAAFDDALARAKECVLAAYTDEHGSWRERVRAGLAAFLMFLDERPEMRAVLIVEPLRAGSRVSRRRAEVLARVGEAIHTGGGSRSDALPAVMGEGVVGAVFGVLHARLLSEPQGSLLDLLNPLMSILILPYEGAAAARRELGRRGVGTFSSGREEPAGVKSPTRLADISVGDPLAGLNMRLTYRTLRVLSAVAATPGASNRAIGESAGTFDQGQISKLLARLEKLGLIHNSAKHGRRPTGEANAWRLTALGERVTHQLCLSTNPRGDVA